ncbi:hypothetical protein H4R20_000668 [Coemansia guatemalensis]|uniref:Uncharacterized protein n=1 Tax=Coemansia guatemalensis TaxID=2761395 RepID=A0A9W8I7B5_9FUNG|nr:hypothetical protein H4R20_000668 [Coemansia guatemalensis]
MKLFSVSIISVLAAATGAFAQNVDWSAADTLACGLEYFSDIKAAVDGNIQPVWDFLPVAVTSRAEEAGIVNPNHSLISNPTAQQLQSMASIFPSGLFSPYADNIVQQCLATYVPTSEEPSDEESTDEETSEPTDEESTDEETSEPTDEESTDEETSEPTDEESTDEETSEEPTSEETSDEESTDDTEEPTSSEPDYSAEPTSTPIKCRPRY